MPDETTPDQTPEEEWEEWKSTLPDITTFEKAQDWDLKNNAEEQLIPQSMKTWSFSQALQMVDQYMHAAVNHDHMDMRTATVRFAALAMRVGYMAGVCSSDWFTDKTFESHGVVIPQVQATEDEVREFVESQIKLREEKEKVPEFSQVQEALKKALEQLGLDPDAVMAVDLTPIAERAASASRDDNERGIEDVEPPGMYL